MKKLFLIYLFTISLIVSGCSEKEEVQNISSVNNIEVEASTTSVNSDLASPFGFKQGITVEDLKAAGIDFTLLSSGAVSVQKAPVVNEKFISYNLTFSKKSGLCQITAFGEESFNNIVKHDVDYHKDILVEKYGNYSNAFPGQSYGYEWISENTKLPKNLEKIVLMFVTSSDFNKGQIALLYNFDNIIDCESEKKEKDASGL